ncbi:hypothetical protein HHK36_006772 [Tetracentron sinense]|uniref:Bet v I/Major latex protein domain-containing protein n=1 Tax=Tetracentron sinense TaxID=13715 RepID=A0A834ZHS8_TETSI|nr:hypothetical protein HHK36_006772 [Tetracentron sinense]
MATISKIEIPIKTSADKFYGIFRHNISHLVDVLPDHYKGMEVVEGDGKTEGSVRHWNFHLGTPMVVKERIGAIDDENKSITFCVFEGDINTHYSTFNATMQVCTEGDGSLVKWSLEFEKTNEEVPHPEHFMELFEKITKEMDAHLLKA